MPQISIIITAYNAEKTIEKCLNSILDTKYNDYEIILVNDGSTDNTDGIVQLFASDKIKYFSKPNTGVADSRNFGIEKANGDYIAFVDSDDYISSNYFENIDSYIQEGIDIIKRKGIILSNTLPQTKIEGATFEITTGEDAFNKLCFTDKYLDTLWSYIIKKSLFTELNFKFEKGRYHEDFGLLPLLILKANKVVSLPDYVYYYVQSENSIMREKDLSKTIKKAQDALYHYDNILSTIETYNLSEVTKEHVGIYLTNAILLKIKEFDLTSTNFNEKSKMNKDDVEDTANSIEDKIENESLKEQYKKAENWYIKELKKRKIYKNIKARNLKQLIKKIILFTNIKLYKIFAFV